jgi:hypothetical protein
MTAFHASTIEDVLDGLQAVVQGAIDAKDSVGIFAALYRQVTLEVQRAIEEGKFDDGPRMSRLDAAFGNRYFNALEAYRRDPATAPACWQVAFGACKDDAEIAIVQHLLLGINAHINLDLAVAVVQTAPGDTVEEIHHDFLLINELLSNTLNKIQSELDELSPLLRVLDFVGGREDEWLMAFSVEHSRGDAWTAALILAKAADETQFALTEDMLDRKASHLARLICHPPLESVVVKLISCGESTDIGKIITAIDRACAR